MSMPADTTAPLMWLPSHTTGSHRCGWSARSQKPTTRRPYPAGSEAWSSRATRRLATFVSTSSFRVTKSFSKASNPTRRRTSPTRSSALSTPHIRLAPRGRPSRRGRTRPKRRRTLSRARSESGRVRSPRSTRVGPRRRTHDVVGPTRPDHGEPARKWRRAPALTFPRMRAPDCRSRRACYGRRAGVRGPPISDASLLHPWQGSCYASLSSSRQHDSAWAAA